MKKFFKKKHITYCIISFILLVYCFIYAGNKLLQYYSPAKERAVYHTFKHQDDTLRIAYIGDSWAYGHKYHSCQISIQLRKHLHKPIKVETYGIGGLTSKEIYYALFEIGDFRHFIEKGYDYCFISAGINYTNKKMSVSYYKKSMDCIIKFLIANSIHSIILEIPDYNIYRTYERQTKKNKLIRKI